MAVTAALNIQSRVRTLRFRAPLSTEEKDSLQTEILMLEGTTKADIVELQLTVEYDFPTNCFFDVWQIVRKNVSAECFKPIERLRNSLIGFVEQNESDHLLYPAHWHTYTQDVYLNYFKQRPYSGNDTQKHLWHRYQKKS